MKTNPADPIFHDENAARKHLEALRWSKFRSCPHCGETERTSPTESKNHKPGLYVCLSCKATFTVTVGTLFERSHIPLHKWLHAFNLMAASKKGISSLQLQRQLGLGSYRTAWFMSHRIREAMKEDGGGLLGSGGGTVEIDETYVGRKPGRKIKQGPAHKNAVFSLVERGGKVRSFHVVDVKADTLASKINENVSRQAKVMTDEAPMYVNLKSGFASHDTVNHGTKEYARYEGANVISTNTIEGYFSIFKRGMFGVYQHVSSHHLGRYCTEFDFRYNHRIALGYTDSQRAEIALKNISGKRLTYRRTSGKQEAAIGA